MTPFELSVCAELNREKSKDKEETDLFMAYINAYWQRVETLKPFNELIGKESAPAVMSVEQMMMNVMSFNSANGGTVIDPSLEERG